MRCEDLLDLLPLHAVDETSVEEALSIEEHIESCARCREALADYGTIVITAVQDLAPVPATPPEPVPIVDDSVRPGWGWWSPRLATAAVLLVVGIVFGRWSAVTPPTTLPDAPTTAASLAGTGRLLPPSRLRSAPLSVFSPAARSYLRRLARERESAAMSEGGTS